VENNLDQWTFGFFLGGLLTGSAIYLLRADKQQKKLFFDKIGKIVFEDLPQDVSIQKKEVTSEILKTIPNKGSVANLFMLAAMSINLLKTGRQIMAKQHHGKQFILGAMLGSTVGALSAIMFTTKKGHAFQKNAMGKLHEFEKYLKQFISKNKGKVMTTMKKVHKIAKRKKSKSR